MNNEQYNIAMTVDGKKLTIHRKKGKPLVIKCKSNKIAVAFYRKLVNNPFLLKKVQYT